MEDNNHDGVPDDVNPEHFRVTIFGSARLKKEDQAYQDIYLLAHQLAEMGMDVVTGGGPGLMEAANRGHKIGRKEGSDVDSYGLNIELPHEQQDNPYLDVKREFAVFSKRLDGFMLLSSIVVVAPGGVGTCLEFFYAWQLMQVKHTCKMPIIMIGDMWPGLIKWIKENPLKKGLLNSEDVESIICVKDWKVAAKLIGEIKEDLVKSGKDVCANLKLYAQRADIEEIL